MKTCKCDTPTTYQNGARTRCKACWLIVAQGDTASRNTPPRPPDAPADDYSDVLADWIRHDLQRGCDVPYIRRWFNVSPRRIERVRQEQTI